MSIDKSRIGLFFLLIGLFLMIIFFATDQSQNPKFWMFFFGILSLSLGIYMALRFRRQPEDSGRFRLLRKYQDTQKEKSKKRRR